MSVDYHAKLRLAVRNFWKIRDRQLAKQGAASGQRDAGTRGAVTGGKQLDAFRSLIRSILKEAGLPDAAIHDREVTLPGYFRPTKEWDIPIKANGHLIATIEFKSQVGSFGNNFNNRTEEALGSATDLWTAHREGAFRGSLKPWLGYFFLLEDASGSRRPVKIREPHFPVFPEFQDSSYAKRYELLCLRLVEERLYDAACFLMSPRGMGKKGEYSEPCSEISFARFVASLKGRVAEFVSLRQQGLP